MKKREFAYDSYDGVTKIHAIEWVPDQEPIAVLQIAHGITEYIDRYDAFAKFLVSKGFVVIGNDHIGHGMSVAADAPEMYFGPKGSWNYAVEDLDRLLENTKARYPGIPYGMMGFSLGSYLVRTYLINYPKKVDAAIIMGSGNKASFEIKIGLFAAWIEKLRCGDGDESDFIDMLTFDTYNRHFAPNRTGFDWLCSDRDGLDAYIADRKRGNYVTPGLFREMLSGIAYAQDPMNVAVMRKKLPILIISGEDDPVGDFGKGVEKLYASFIRTGLRDTTLKMYPGLRHDILHEANHLEIYDYLSTWLEAKLLRRRVK